MIPKGQNVDGFMPVLRTDNAGEKLPAGFQSGDTEQGAGRREIALQAAWQAELETPGSARQLLFQLQSAVASSPPVDFPLQHLFAPAGEGQWLYSRTILLPKGSLIVGKIHKHSHPNILSQGTVRVFTEAGGSETLTGPLSMVSSPGTKRAVLAETDAVWTTLHLTTSTDLVKVEAELIASSYADYEVFQAQEDYRKFLREAQLTQEQLDKIMGLSAYLGEMPMGYSGLEVRKSPIAGNGVFTQDFYSAGGVIGPARLSGLRTPLGRYVNHAADSNAEFRRMANGDLVTVATRDILVGKEILNNYRQGLALYQQDLIKETL